MNTYSPISGMIICQNDTGDYVAKPDYDALIQTLAQERQGRETAEADAYRMVDRVLRGEHSENCPFCAKIKMDGTSQQVPMCRLCDVEATLDTERQRAEKAERELVEVNVAIMEYLTALSSVWDWKRNSTESNINEMAAIDEAIEKARIHVAQKGQSWTHP